MTSDTEQKLVLDALARSDGDLALRFVLRFVVPYAVVVLFTLITLGIVRRVGTAWVYPYLIITVLALTTFWGAYAFARAQLDFFTKHKTLQIIWAMFRNRSRLSTWRGRLLRAEADRLDGVSQAQREEINALLAKSQREEAGELFPNPELEPKHRRTSSVRGRKDREGWKDDSDADSSSFRSNPAGSSLFGGVYRESRATEPWDAAWAADGVFREGRPTTIPDTLQELYAILVVLNGPRRFDLHRIGERKVTIGRDSTDIVLEDSAVGRQHAIITVAGNDQNDAEFRILDRAADGLPSRTGIVVNGRHVSEVVLRDRDHIQIGETRLLFVQTWP